jgi:signal transduction histidine kinase
LFNAARWRLTFWFSGAFAAILVLVGLAVLLAARTAIYDQVNDDLRSRSEPLLRSVGGPFDPGRRELLRFATAGGYFFAVTGPGGNTIQGSESVDDVQLPPLTELQSKADDGPAFIDTQTADGEDIRLYALPVSGIRGETFYFQVGRSIEPEQQALRRLFLIVGISGFGGLALAIAGGYWIAGRALRPIQRSVDAQRVFVADASHELRTPLALIRANAEMIKRDAEAAAPAYADDIIGEADRMTYLVGQMLTLARSDAETAVLQAEPVDLGHVAQDVARQMRVLAAGKRIEIRTEVTGANHVMGDLQRLGELALILLDNAVKYTEDGGSVWLAVARRDDRSVLTVSDTGRGIPADSLGHVFDRFYRVDKARSREMGGTGLGLSIARWIAESHGGTIGIQSAEGSGTTVTVSLPAISQPLGVSEPAPADGH